MGEFGKGELRSSLEDTASIEVVKDQWAVTPAEMLRQCLKPRTKVLEIGPGPRVYENLYPNSKVFLLDISQPVLNRQARGLRRTRGNVEKIPYQNESFDAVVVANLPPKVIDWEKALAEIERVLKSKGLVLLSLPLSRKEDVKNAVQKATDLLQEEFKIEKAVKQASPRFPKIFGQLWILARKVESSPLFS